MNGGDMNQQQQQQQQQQQHQQWIAMQQYQQQWMAMQYPAAAMAMQQQMMYGHQYMPYYHQQQQKTLQPQPPSLLPSPIVLPSVLPFRQRLQLSITAGSANNSRQTTHRRKIAPPFRKMTVTTNSAPSFIAFSLHFSNLENRQPSPPLK